jgi:O-methyltransferase involved in polyketide biosynthesis
MRNRSSHTAEPVALGQALESVRGGPRLFVDPAQLAAYLAERGIFLPLDMSTREAGARYLEPLGRHEPAPVFCRIAEAEVR